MYSQSEYDSAPNNSLKPTRLAVENAVVLSQSSSYRMI